MSFFEVASYERVDSPYKWPTLHFCCHAQCFGGVADFTKKLKIEKNRRNVALTLLPKPAARTKLDFFAPGRDLASILVAPACSLASFLASERPSRAPGNAPGRSQDGPDTPLERTWAPQGVLRGSWDRFWLDYVCPGAAPRTDFCMIFTSVLDLIAQANWTTKNKLLDRQLPLPCLVPLSWWLPLLWSALKF